MSDLFSSLPAGIKQSLPKDSHNIQKNIAENQKNIDSHQEKLKKQAKNLKDGSGNPINFNLDAIKTATKTSFSKQLNDWGLTNDAINNLTKAVHSHNQKPEVKAAIQSEKYRKNFYNSYNKFKNSRENYYKNLEEYCNENKDDSICKEYINIQQNLLNIKIDEIEKLNKDMRETITTQINAYSSETISFFRMSELLAARIKEVNHNEIKIDKLLKEINTDNRKSVYKQENKSTNQQIQYVFIYVYFELILFYLFSSSFFANQDYRKPLHVILLILYMIIPFVIKYIIIYFYNLYLSFYK